MCCEISAMCCVSRFASGGREISGLLPIKESCRQHQCHVTQANTDCYLEMFCFGGHLTDGVIGV